MALVDGFVVTHRYGDMERCDDLGAVDRLLAELDEVDDEHPEVSVAYGDWSLSLYPNGDVIWGNVEDDDEGPPRHLVGLPRSEMARLARAVATGDLATVEARPWMPGYPPTS